MKPTRRYSRYFTYIQPLTKLPVIRTYGSTILAVVTIIIFILFAIKPTVETILVLQKKIDDSKEVLAKIEKKSQDLSQGRTNLENLDTAVTGRLAEALPPTPSYKTITETLEQSALVNNASVSALQIQSITLESSESGHQKLTEINFTFNAEGSYKNLINLMKDLQKGLRVLTIDSLSFNKISDSANILVSIGGKAYFFK